MAPPSESDLRCLDRACAGDETGLADLYDRYAPLLYGVVLKIVRTPSDAEDTLQEAWIQAWRTCATYDPARGSVVSWLLSIARSRALDRVRRRSVQQRTAATAQQEAVPHSVPVETSQAAEIGQLQVRVGAALQGLDPKQRRALELAYWNGLSHAKISEELGAPLGTVKSWVRTGLANLRRQIPREEWT